MGKISIDRIIRNMGSYSRNEIMRLIRACNEHLNLSNKQVDIDDVEVTQAGVSAAFQKMREQRDFYKNRCAELENDIVELRSFMPMQVIGFGHRITPNLQLPEGKSTINTAVGVSMWLSNGNGSHNTVIDWKIYTGDIESAKRDIVGALFTAVERSPSLSDLGSQVIDGLTSPEIIEVCKGLSPIDTCKLISLTQNA